MDQWIWGYDKMSHYLPLYEPFMNKEDLTLLFSQNPKDFMSCLSIASKKNLFRTMVLDLNYVEKIGGYERLEKSISKKLIEETQIQSLSFNKNIKISENHLLYLRKIIDFCRQYGKVVYLIRSPQHKSLPELANESQFQNILNIRFNDVEFLDFNAFSLPNEYFADLEHLNYKGAEEYSIWFANLLRNGLLNSKNKKLLIKERN